MDSNFVRLNSVPRKLLSLTCVLVCSIIVFGAGQNNKQALSVRERVEKIVRERLSEGTSTANGIKIQTRTPPSAQVRKEIRECGNDAIPVLTNYSRSEHENERVIAVELLGILGGARIVTPLRNVVEKDASPTIRILALRWLSQAPSNLASPIIRKAARTDADEGVRKVARDILRLRPSEERPDGFQPFQKMPST